MFWVFNYVVQLLGLLFGGKCKKNYTVLNALFCYFLLSYFSKNRTIYPRGLWEWFIDLPKWGLVLPRQGRIGDFPQQRFVLRITLPHASTWKNVV